MAQDEQGQADTHQPPAQPYPLPFPVELIEDQTAVDTRERREAEAHQYQQEDLVAQQGMNAATQSIDQATQDMRNYAYVQTWLVGVGTALLVITLGLTYQANRAAVAAVQITRETAIRQLRAYVCVETATFICDDANVISGVIKIKNYGVTPAHDLKASLQIDCLPHDHVVTTEMQERGAFEDSMVLGPGTAVDLEDSKIIHSWRDRSNVSDDTNFWAPFMFGIISYTDAFNIKRNTRYAFVARENVGISDGIAGGVCSTGNYAD